MVLISTIFGMFLGMNPTGIPLPLVQVLGSLTLLVAGILHMIVMPKLSSFMGLGIMLFLYAFTIACLFSKPKYMPVRFLTLGFSSMVLQITNDQAYSFYYVVDMLVAFQVPFFLLRWITRTLPISFRPEAVFQRLLRRYMMSLRSLIADYCSEQNEQYDSWWKRQWRAYHLRNLMRIPDKMSSWVEVMPKAAMDADEKEQAQGLCLSLYEMANQALALHQWQSNRRYDVARRKQSMPALRLWRENLEQLTQTFYNMAGRRPDAAEQSIDLNVLLGEVKKALDDILTTSTQSTDAPVMNELLREMSLYRRLSETLMSASEQASALHWERICETRF